MAENLNAIFNSNDYYHRNTESYVRHMKT